MRFTSTLQIKCLPKCRPRVRSFGGGPTKTCYFYNATELTQTPNSHHSILHMYRGEYDLSWERDPEVRSDPDGFQFRCQGGDSEGEICDPRQAEACGDPALCYGNPVSTLACIGYGPPDYSRGLSAVGGAGSDNAPSVGGSQQPYLLSANPAGVFGVFPAEGVLVANSHAFNLFDSPQTNEQWWNIWFAGEEDRDFLNRAIFDATDIFWCPDGRAGGCPEVSIPPFEEREYCRTVTFPEGSRVFELSSHTHERGRLFRTWGPGIEQSCSTAQGDICEPEAGPPIAVTTEYNDPTVLRLLGDEEHDLRGLTDPADRRYKFLRDF